MRRAEAGRDLPPGVNADAVAQEAAEELVKFLGALEAQRTQAQDLQGGFAVGVPDRRHQVAEFGWGRPGEGADGLGIRFVEERLG